MRLKWKDALVLHKINVYFCINTYKWKCLLRHEIFLFFVTRLSRPQCPMDLKHILKCYHPLRFQDVSEATKDPQTNKSASPVICLFQSIVSPVHIQLSKLYPQVNIMVLIILNFRWVIAALPGTGLNAYTISMLSFYSQDNDSRDVGNKWGKSYYWPNLPPSGNFQVTLYGGVNRMERTRLLELRWSWKYRKAQTASVCRREYLTKLCS